MSLHYATFIGLAFFGTDAGLSALIGGLAYALPTTFHFLAMWIAKGLRLGVGSNVLATLFGELVKVLCVILLLLIAARLYAGLNWFALIISLIAVAKSCFVLLFKKR